MPETQRMYNLFETMGSRNGSAKLSPTTINNYIAKMRKISQVVNGVPYMDNMDWILDADTVIDALNTDSKLTNRKDYLSPLCKIIRHMGGHEEVLNKYLDLMAKSKDDEHTARAKNQAKHADVAKALPMSVINTKIDEYEENMRENPSLKAVTNLLIVKMYFRGELVPRNDLADFKILRNNKRPDRSSRDFNYIVVDDNNYPSCIIMNRYKTSYKYGMQKFKVPADLANTVQDYLDATNKAPGSFLFDSYTGRAANKHSFRRVLRDAMTDVLGRPLNINLIRSIRITDYVYNGPHSIEEDEEFARGLLHSTSIQKEYLKLNLPHSKSLRTHKGKKDAAAAEEADSCSEEEDESDDE